MLIKEPAAKIQPVVGYAGSIVCDANKPDSTPRKFMAVGRLARLDWNLLTYSRSGLTNAYASRISVECSDTGEIMELIFRISNWLYLSRIPFVPRLLYIFNRIVFSIVLPPSVKVGRNVAFSYSGLGIVIHARCQIGNGVTISQHVTLGGRSGLLAVPVVEDDVLIGAGAKILGPVRIGRGASIGANSVVLHDVPPFATVVGIPGRVIKIGAPMPGEIY